MNERMMLLFTIIPRGVGAYVVKLLTNNGMPWHLRAVGQGTATSEVMDILGMGSRDKDIVITIGAKRAAEAFMTKLSNDPTLGKGNGITMVMRLDAINSLTAVFASRAAENINTQEADVTMKNEYKHSLVFVAVNRGCSDDVMQVARKAGATGGTVIRANLADNDAAELLGVTLKEERDIVAIMVPDTIRDAVMEDVNRELGLRTDAQAIVCSVGVEKALRI